MQAGILMRLEPVAGPAGETVLVVQYTIAPGKDYGIERQQVGVAISGRPELRLQAKATRVLHLGVVLVDLAGQEHECTRTLLPDAWRELQFSDWVPALDDWGEVRALRLVDRTGGLGGQGPVSLRLVGLPLD
jgi:hypothetical protein